MIKVIVESADLDGYSVDILKDVWDDSISLGRHGLQFYSENIPNFEDFAYRYNGDKKTYQNILNCVNELKNANVEYYDDFGTVYLQLSDTPVAQYVDFDNDAEYYDAVDLELDSFQRENDVEIFQLGKFGKHICIADTATNLYNYIRIRDEYLEAENKFIRTYSKM